MGGRLGGVYRRGRVNGLGLGTRLRQFGKFPEAEANSAGDPVPPEFGGIRLELT